MWRWRWRWRWALRELGEPDEPGETSGGGWGNRRDRGDRGEPEELGRNGRNCWREGLGEPGGARGTKGTKRTKNPSAPIPEFRSGPGWSYLRMHRIVQRRENPETFACARRLLWVGVEHAILNDGRGRERGGKGIQEKPWVSGRRERGV